MPIICSVSSASKFMYKFIMHAGGKTRNTSTVFIRNTDTSHSRKKKNGTFQGSRLHTQQDTVKNRLFSFFLLSARLTQHSLNYWLSFTHKSAPFSQAHFHDTTVFYILNSKPENLKRAQDSEIKKKFRACHERV